MAQSISSRLLMAEHLRRCELDECQAACCLHGVWLDLREVKDILSHASIIQNHMPAGWEDSTFWLDGCEEVDEKSPSGIVQHTAVVEAPEHYGGTACVFLRSDHKCALQVAADFCEFHPWRFKPFYCILHPLDLDENGQITLDNTDLLLAEPASCLRLSEDEVPLLITFEPELRYLLGDRAYRELQSGSGLMIPPE